MSVLSLIDLMSSQVWFNVKPKKKYQPTLLEKK